MTDSKEGALSRWSRRKQEARTVQQPEDGTAVAAPESRAPLPDAGPRPVDASLDVANLREGAAVAEDEAPLPDIETLNYESDYSGFLRETVSDDLRRRALRKLWASNPLLANLDGLNDYDLDYTIPEMQDLAAQAAEDLRRGTKRKSLSDLRLEERDRKRGQTPIDRRGKPRKIESPAGEDADLEQDRAEPERAGLTKADSPHEQG
ncbi:MAG: DUF3306 domain-containing protein [Hyphomicrobiales bacterium]